MSVSSSRRRLRAEHLVIDDLTSRHVEAPVRPADALVIARMLAISVLSLVVFSWHDGPSSENLGFMVLGLALLQPLLPTLWPRREAFQQAQMLSDVAAFVVFGLVAPEYYWLYVIVIASIVASHAVLAARRKYAVVAVVATGAIGAIGMYQSIEFWERAFAVSVVLAIGHGYLGFRSRSVMDSSRRDLLHALGAAGGLAHLTDLHGGVVDVVGDVEAITGWTRDEWLSMDHRNIVHPDDFDGFWTHPTDVEPGAVIDRMARLRTVDGRWIWIRDISRVVVHGHRKYLQGFCIDVTAQQDGLTKVVTEASTDALTGLRNRRWLLAELAIRENVPGYFLVLIDLNRFKDVNDTLGHEAGDELLEVVADRLSKCLRPNDVLARLGGDEFAIVMDGMKDATSVAAAVDRFALEVSRPVEVSGVSLTTSVSAGIAEAHAGACDPTTMLRHADIAMYSAKRLGQSAVVFDADLEQRTERRTSLSTSLPDALKSGRLTLHYQPIIAVADGEIAGVEGLARWDHPEFGLLRPDAFLDVILMSERSGEFTREMVSQAIDTASRLAEIGSDIPVSVNLPIRTLEDVGFERWFSAECTGRQVSPRRIVFEIAERDIHDTGSITEAIDRLAALGVTISVDDFGAGHATFERLRWRNVDQLKLDSEVMRHATTDVRERAILRSVLQLAAELGYAVVAEGVERADQLDLLKRLGCPLVQGFLYAGALSVDDLLASIADGVLPPMPEASDSTEYFEVEQSVVGPR